MRKCEYLESRRHKRILIYIELESMNVFSCFWRSEGRESAHCCRWCLRGRHSSCAAKERSCSGPTSRANMLALSKCDLFEFCSPRMKMQMCLVTRVTTAFRAFRVIPDLPSSNFAWNTHQNYLRHTSRTAHIMKTWWNWITSDTHTYGMPLWFFVVVRRPSLILMVTPLNNKKHYAQIG